MCLKQTNPSYPAHLQYVRRRIVRSPYETKRLVLASKPVIDAVRKETNGRGAVKARQTREKSEQMLNAIHSTLEDQPPRTFAWMLRKVWRQMFDKILVHEAGIERVSILARNNVASPKATPIVLLPSHRSYADFLLLSYVFFAYNLPVPHIAAAEDFAKLGKGLLLLLLLSAYSDVVFDVAKNKLTWFFFPGPVTNLLRSSGAFFLKRDGAVLGNELYATVFEEYLARLLEDGEFLLLF